MTLEYANKIIDDMRLDKLTRLLRKDIFIDLLSKEISYTNREKNYSFSVAYIDIDNFKSVNDSYGHYSGDKVIEKIGEFIRKNIRSSDIGFRIGGDEFAILFKHANKDKAKQVCAKISAECKAYDFIFNENTTFNVSLSIGISEYVDQAHFTIDTFIVDVDKKLYISKKDGKKRITI